MNQPHDTPKRPRGAGARWLALPVVGTVLLLAVGGCGEKIAVPVAEGIPTSTTYIEAQPWQLTDPTDIAEWVGKLFVLEGTPGTLTKYNTQRVVDAAATGLRMPVALAKEQTGDWLAVAEAGVAGVGGPRVSWFERGALGPQGEADLTGRVLSIGGIAVADSFVFVSDPDSGVVHRFKRGEDRISLTPQGLVADNHGSTDSPNYVFAPRGLQLDTQGMLLICDADTTRNWVVRFDPTPPANNPSGRGTSVGFRPPTPGCVQDLKALVLGRAPECGQSGFELGPSSELGEFHTPVRVTMDAGDSQDLFRLYVVDQLNGRVQRFDSAGTFELVIGQVAGSTGSFGQPAGVATWLATVFAEETIRFPGARVYVVDRGTNQVRVFEDEVWLKFTRNTP